MVSFVGAGQSRQAGRRSTASNRSSANRIGTNIENLSLRHRRARQRWDAINVGFLLCSVEIQLHAPLASLTHSNCSAKPWTVDIGLIIHIESRPPQRGWQRVFPCATVDRMVVPDEGFGTDLTPVEVGGDHSSRARGPPVDYGDKLPPSQWYIFTPPRRYIFSPPLTDHKALSSSAAD